MTPSSLAGVSALLLGLAGAAAWAQPGSEPAPAGPAATAPGPAAAPATTGKPSRAGQAGKLDSNQDGYLSLQEVQGNRKLAARFSQIDTDKDGRLSRDELHQAQQQAKGGKSGEGAATGGKGASVSKLDLNGDQMISRDEAAKMPRLSRHFDAADTNHDGQLSPDELAALRSSTAKAP